MSDREDMLYRAATDATTTARYFLLGVAASAIGFVFHETADRHITLSLWVAGAAVIVWSLGFGAGIYSLRRHRAVIGSNLNFLIMERLARGIPPEHIGDSLEQARDRLDKMGDSEPFYGACLEWSLPLGAALYGAAHVLHLLGR